MTFVTLTARKTVLKVIKIYKIKKVAESKALPKSIKGAKTQITKMQNENIKTKMKAAKPTAKTIILVTKPTARIKVLTIKAEAKAPKSMPPS